MPLPCYVINKSNSDGSLLYLMTISYMLQYLDKTSLGYGAINSMIKDTVRHAG